MESASADDRAAAVLHVTRALCPQCLRELPATVFAEEDGTVWMSRSCPEHGDAITYVWPDAEHYEWIRSLAFPPVAPKETIAASAPCPFGCGPCSRHRRKGTLLEIEVTQRCNLHCPVCFMSAEDSHDDPTFEEIGGLYDTITRVTGTDTGVQLTGGEPTVREDLPEIIALGRKKGFWGIEINTNGLVIARRPGYLEKLVAAGLTGVYLSFDGFTDEVYRATTGADLAATKLRVIERCREAQVQCVLAMTVVSGVNDDQLGSVLRLALDNADIVAGLALQPAFTSGRFEADRRVAMTMGDVIFMLADQSEGLIEPKDIWPLGTSHPLCDAGTFLIPSEHATHPSGYVPATRALSESAYRAGFNPDSPQGSVFPDLFARQGIDVSQGISLIIMNYMDAHTMDVERLRECSMLVTVPDGRAIPFCSYHLTDGDGERVYPPWCRTVSKRASAMRADASCEYAVTMTDGAGVR